MVLKAIEHEATISISKLLTAIWPITSRNATIMAGSQIARDTYITQMPTPAAINAFQDTTAESQNA